MTDPAGPPTPERADDSWGREEARLHDEVEALMRSLPERIDADPEKLEAGLARLVLALVEFLRRVLEHQAVARLESGSLSEEEEERLGMAFLRMKDKMVELRGVFGLSEEDLELDLGPLGRLL